MNTLLKTLTHTFIDNIMFLICSVTWSTCSFIGSALGGFTAAAAGVATCFIIDAISYMLAGIVIWNLLRYPYREAAKVVDDGSDDPLVNNEGDEQSSFFALTEDEDEVDKLEYRASVEINKSEQEKQESTKESSTNEEDSRVHDASLESIDLNSMEVSVSVPTTKAQEVVSTENQSFWVAFKVGVLFLVTNPSIASTATLKGCGAFIWGASNIVSRQINKQTNKQTNNNNNLLRRRASWSPNLLIFFFFCVGVM